MSLDTIDTAAYAALQTLAASASPTPGPFSFVGRFTGQVQVRAGQVTLAREALGRNPALLWQWEGEAADNDFESDEGDRESRGVSTFVAWVVVGDTRGVAQQVKGATATSGAMALHERVLGALNGLTVANTLRHHRVDWVGTKNHATEMHHVSEIRFEVKRNAPTAEEAVQGVPLVRLDGSINLTPEYGDNPMTRIRSTP